MASHGVKLTQACRLFPQLCWRNYYIQKRSHMIGWPTVDPPVEPRKYEITREPEEWHYVTRLLPQKTVPQFNRKPEYPSGWVPPLDEGRNNPYYVERTKNHQLPLYIHHEDRGQRKITVIKRINGDIWLLHKEIKQYVEQQFGRKISSQVLECNSIVKFKGDHYHWVEQWLLNKGF